MTMTVPTRRTMTLWIGVMVVAAMMPGRTEAFMAPRPMGTGLSVSTGKTWNGLYRHEQKPQQAFQQATLFRSHRVSTRQNMYNLPPPGGNKNNNNNELTDIVKGILGIVGLSLFFSSPLGGVFFAITNSIFALLFLSPFILYVGFQIWQVLNTFEAPCPNCGAPNRVTKDSNVLLCTNCGTFIRANPDGETIDLVGNSMNDSGGGLFGGAGGGLFGSLFDEMVNQDPSMINSDPFGTESSSLFGEQFNSPKTTSKDMSVDDKAKKFKREQTIIDVEVDEED